MVGRAIVAGHLDISTTALRGLIEAKVIDNAEPGEMDLDASRVSYIRHLRAGASGRGGDSLSRERARLASEQADRAARENKLASAEVIERRDVIAIMTAGFPDAKGWCQTKANGSAPRQLKRFSSDNAVRTVAENFFGS